MRFKNYILDEFQIKAIEAINEEQSVIVSAPTGAGKTVIAEYVIEKLLQDSCSVIYTAPIKALSNQKYRDFSKDYPGKVGIMTGDVILSPNAPILIMTTEIFRNMVFDNDERLDDLAYVIFDEIHYINDIQRGTVWEESIIFAPQHIKFLCLSAAIPNIKEFALWMQSVRNVKIETVVETVRPVPLTTYVYIREHGFKAVSFLKSLEREKGALKKWRERISAVQPVVEHLKKNNQFPCLYFLFGRAACRDAAMSLQKLSFLAKQERTDILEMFDGLCKQFNVIGKPGIDNMRTLLARGIAYHHAGILPALKEIIERLYSLGLIKILFTTETFAAGINMPAKSAIFESLQKHDGTRFRYITGREFQQMSGRAGRRGIDKVGYAYAVIQPSDYNLELIDSILSQKEIEPIESQFSLSYNGVLNLYKTFGNRMFEVSQKSFANYTYSDIAQKYREEVDIITQKTDRIKQFRCLFGKSPEKLQEFIKAQHHVRNLKKQRKKAQKNNNIDKIEYIISCIDTAEPLYLKSDCLNCKRRKNCENINKQLFKQQNKIKILETKIIETEELHTVEIKKKIQLLKKMGYIDKEDLLLPRGQFATQVFGYELQLTEMLFDGLFHELSEIEINILIQAVVFESRRGTKFERIENEKVNKTLKRLDILIKNIRNLEKTYKIFTTTKLLDAGLCRAILEWCQGCAFENLVSYTTEDEGDIVRYFRLTVDALRQIKRAVKDISLQKKIDKGIKLIYRDVVDAEAQLSVGI